MTLTPGASSARATPAVARSTDSDVRAGELYSAPGAGLGQPLGLSRRPQQQHCKVKFTGLIPKFARLLRQDSEGPYKSLFRVGPDLRSTL
jgi:hypothetical protein